MQSREECEQAVKLFQGTPMLLNMVGAGKTPQMTVNEARAVGFKIMIWPSVGLEAVVPALRRAFEVLKTEGKEAIQPIGPNKLFEICGLKELMAFDESVGGKAFGGP